MPFYEKGPVRIHYEEIGEGYPLLLIPGGGLNATIGNFTGDHTLVAPFNPLVEFSGKYRCITLDQRNANGGESTGPVDAERNWDAFTDDHLGLMDHLGIEKFMVMGFCIGGPLIWNLLRRASERVDAAVLVQPSGYRPEMPDLFYQNNIANWGPALCKSRPDVSMDMIEPFLNNMYRARADFVFTVDRKFVRGCETPILILPDDIPAHPYAVAMETALLAPNAESSLYPWKDAPQRTRLALRHVHTFLRANCPAG